MVGLSFGVAERRSALSNNVPYEHITVNIICVVRAHFYEGGIFIGVFDVSVARNRRLSLALVRVAARGGQNGSC